MELRQRSMVSKPWSTAATQISHGGWDEQIHLEEWVHGWRGAHTRLPNKRWQEYQQGACSRTGMSPKEFSWGWEILDRWVSQSSGYRSGGKLHVLVLGCLPRSFPVVGRFCLSRPWDSPGTTSTPLWQWDLWDSTLENLHQTAGSYDHTGGHSAIINQMNYWRNSWPTTMEPWRGCGPGGSTRARGRPGQSQQVSP